jgi:hypothetical protein
MSTKCEYSYSRTTRPVTTRHERPSTANGRVSATRIALQLFERVRALSCSSHPSTSVVVPIPFLPTIDTQTVEILFSSQSHNLTGPLNFFPLMLIYGVDAPVTTVQPDSAIANTKGNSCLHRRYKTTRLHRIRSWCLSHRQQ